MKKFGFTLAELLVTLAIVAVASALMAPAFTNIMPDKYKVRVLKYYSMVANATNDMLDNEAIYYSGYDANGNPSCIGLECNTETPLVHPYNTNQYVGVHKYRNILVNMLDLVPSGANYTTPDGTIWSFRTQPIAGVGLRTTITLTFDSKAENYVFSANHKNPNQFKFRVDRNGEVFAGDAMTDAYLHNPTNRDKKIDRETALRYLNDPTKNINY